MLAAGGTDVVNGQIYGSSWASLWTPGAAVGPTLRGVGGDMGLPTLPYLTTQQTGGASAGSGRVLSGSSILVLGAMLALSVLLMYHIHWS